MKQLQKVGKLNMFLVCMVKNFDDKTYKVDCKKDSYRNGKHESYFELQKTPMQVAIRKMEGVVSKTESWKNLCYQTVKLGTHSKRYEQNYSQMILAI